MLKFLQLVWHTPLHHSSLGRPSNRFDWDELERVMASCSCPGWPVTGGIGANARVGSIIDYTVGPIGGGGGGGDSRWCDVPLQHGADEFLRSQHLGWGRKLDLDTLERQAEKAGLHMCSAGSGSAAMRC